MRLTTEILISTNIHIFFFFQETKIVEAIFLDATESRHINLSPKTFEKMPNLRFLAFQDKRGIKSVSLPSGLDSLPKNLRYFLWDGYPWKSLPPTFCSEMLVEVSLRDSHVEKLWNVELVCTVHVFIITIFFLF